MPVAQLVWSEGPPSGQGSAPSCYKVGIAQSDTAAQASAQLSQGCAANAYVPQLLGQSLDYQTAYRWCVQAVNQFGQGAFACAGFTTEVGACAVTPAAR